jgi:phage gpG-like protein
MAKGNFKGGKDGIQLDFKAGAVLTMLLALEGVSMEAIHADLGEEMIQITRQRLTDGKDAWGVPFEPIKNYTYSFGTIKKKRKTGQKPLKVGLGAPPLFDSFEYEASSEEVLFGTPVFHAKFHSDYPDNNQGPREVIPLREFMGIEIDQDYARLVGVVEDHFYSIAEVQGNLV